MNDKKTILKFEIVELFTNLFGAQHKEVIGAEKDLDSKKIKSYDVYLDAYETAEVTEDDYAKHLEIRGIWIASYMAVRKAETGENITKKSGAKAYQRFIKDLEAERMKSENKDWGRHDFAFPVRKATAESQVKAEQRKAKKDAHAKTDAGKKETLAKSQLAQCREMKVDIADNIQKVINNASGNLEMVKSLYLILSSFHTDIAGVFVDGMIANGELKATKRKPRAK